MAQTITVGSAISPLHLAMDGKNGKCWISDTGQASFLNYINLSDNSASRVTLPSGQGGTWGIAVTAKGVVYASMPQVNKYLQIKPGNDTATPFTTRTNGGTDTRPQAVALNSDDSELWIANAGSNTIVYAGLNDLNAPNQVASVQFSYSSQLQPPDDILLTGGI
jgi:DNA-binding beta-propeller fold protein YncE